MTDFTTGLAHAVDHLKQTYAGLQTGRANVSMVDNIQVESYGQMMPLKNIANIGAPDAQTLRIEPWDKAMLAPIEKALQEADLGINPQNMGTNILLPIPPMTEDRRKKLVKVVHSEAETARISVRTVRHDELKRIKQEFDDKNITEDDKSREEKRVQEAVDKTNNEIQEMMKQKESDIMKV